MHSFVSDTSYIYLSGSHQEVNLMLYEVIRADTMVLTLSLLLLFADMLYKQFGPR